MSRQHPRTIYLVGPTASGKTALSIELAHQLGAEIVCADSQTVRRDMNIGTAKPTLAEMNGIPHHMLDQIDPYDQYSLAIFQSNAKVAISNIHAAHKPAVIVGGTGLYIDALYFNFKLPEIPTTPQNINAQEQRSSFVAGSNPVEDVKGQLEGFSEEELREIIDRSGLAMPKNERNRRHLINVILRAGSVGGASSPDPRSIIIGVNPGREVLIERIDKRVDDMFENGFVSEVESIVTKYSKPPKTFDAIGYRIVMRMLNGEISEAEAKELFKIADRQYAKRQIAWFKRNKDIVWFESPDPAKAYIINHFALNS